MAGAFLEAYPSLGDDAEGSFGAQEQAVGEGPAPEAGSRHELLVPAGVTTRSDWTKSSMCVRPVA